MQRMDWFHDLLGEYMQVIDPFSGLGRHAIISLLEDAFDQSTIKLCATLILGEKNLLEICWFIG